MSPEERTLITQLFDRLRAAATAPRDPEAETFIRQQIAQQPYAPYAMAQTIVAQTKALEAAQGRIQQLENQEQPAAPAFGSRDRFADEPMGAPGNGGPARSPWRTDRQPGYGQAQQPGYGQAQQPGYGQAQQPGYGQPQQPGYGQAGGGAGGGPWGQSAPQPMQQPQGGGFLAGAMQTALGVAGGAMLFEGMRGMFGGGGAEAKESSSLVDSSGIDKLAGGESGSSDSSDAGADSGGGWGDMFGGGDDGGGGGGDDWG